MDLGSIERETHIKLFIEWVMPYPDFLHVILNIFLVENSNVRPYNIVIIKISPSRVGQHWEVTNSMKEN
jgi:hypothetical protein